MKIGNIETKNNVFLAPMAGVTDLVFRVICKEMDCGMVYSEMVSAKGVQHNNKNTKELLKFLFRINKHIDNSNNPEQNRHPTFSL